MTFSDNRVTSINHDAADDSVYINSSQRFTGVVGRSVGMGRLVPLPSSTSCLIGRAAWSMFDQIQMFLSSITAVRTAIELEPALDSALVDVRAALAQAAP